MNHRYFYTLRPPDYGCQPDGWTAREGGLPKKTWISARGPINAFGWVEYADALPLDRAWRYDLLPADSVEYAHYIFWEFSGRDLTAAQGDESIYIPMYNDPEDRKFIPNDILEACRILAEQSTGGGRPCLTF